MTEWYYAKDGQQNGPVTFDDLKHLAASGGLNAEKDMVWKSSMPDWLPSGEIQGLFIPSAAPDAPAADPSNPYAAPQSDVSGPVSSGGGLAEIIPGSEPIDAVACVKRGFELTKRHFGILVLVGLTYIGVSIGAGLILGVVDSALGLGRHDPDGMAATRCREWIHLSTGRERVQRDYFQRAVDLPGSGSVPRGLESGFRQGGLGRTCCSARGGNCCVGSVPRFYSG